MGNSQQSCSTTLVGMIAGMKGDHRWLEAQAFYTQAINRVVPIQSITRTSGNSMVVGNFRKPRVKLSKH